MKKTALWISLIALCLAAMLLFSSCSCEKCIEIIRKLIPCKPQPNDPPITEPVEEPPVEEPPVEEPPVEILRKEDKDFVRFLRSILWM